MPTLESLQTKIQKLQAQADALVARKSSAVIDKIRTLMAEHGLTTADIEAHAGGTKGGRKLGGKAAAKSSASTARYRDPNTGATWSGHGRAPGWIARAKDRSKYLILGNAVAAPAPGPAAKKPAKAGNYVRGPQPAVYRDPKSGATWSGRGRAPAWLAGAKDRTKFLIDAVSGAADSSAENKSEAVLKKPVTKAVAAKKAPAKKAPAKKASAKKAAAKKVTGGKGLTKKSAKKAPRESGAMSAAATTIGPSAESTT